MRTDPFPSSLRSCEPLAWRNCLRSVEIAEDRLKVVERLEVLQRCPRHRRKTTLQQLIADAPWLVNPEWAPVTENQSFSRLRKEFEKYYEDRTGNSISLSDFQKTGKRPDFVLSSQEGTVQIIEIKKTASQADQRRNGQDRQLLPEHGRIFLATRPKPNSGSTLRTFTSRWCATALH